MALTIQYDASADAAFIEVAQGKSANTIVVSDDLNVDFDSEGRLLSIEILAVSRVAPSLAYQAAGAIAAE
jgi:uncharacterized protein YuzE